VVVVPVAKTSAENGPDDEDDKQHANPCHAAFGIFHDDFSLQKIFIPTTISAGGTVFACLIVRGCPPVSAAVRFVHR
jgi:hypothetical protein